MTLRGIARASLTLAATCQAVTRAHTPRRVRTMRRGPSWGRRTAPGHSRLPPDTANALGNSTAAYDADAHVTSVVAPVPGSTTHATYTDTYGYDASGNSASTSTPSGAFSYAWRGDDKLATRTAIGTTSLGYDAAG